MTKLFTSGMLKWGKAAMYLYYNPWVCLSRKTQVAKCISNCCVSSLVKTSISTKISMLRLSPMQRFKTHRPSAVKIQNFFITMWFLPTRRTRTAISSCLFQTMAVSLPPLCQKHILKMFHSPGFFCRTEEGRQASWHAQQWQSQVLTMLRNVRKHEHSPNMVLQLPLSWCCSSKLTQVGYKHGGEFWLKQGFHWEETSAQFGHWFFIKSFFSADSTDSLKPLFP